MSDFDPFGSFSVKRSMEVSLTHWNERIRCSFRVQVYFKLPEPMVAQ